MRTDQHPPDTGCSLAPSCLACPLPQCRYDVPVLMQKRMHQRRVRDGQILVALTALPLSKRGERAQAVAAQVGVTVRTVYRALERQRMELRR